MTQVSEEQRRAFEREGWFHVGAVFEPGELDEIREEYDRLLARGIRLGERAKTPFEYSALLHLQSALLCARACDPRLVRVAMALLGDDVRLYWDQAVCKPPGASSNVPWHQDNGYAPVVPEEYVTFTVALDATTKENGCIVLLPGSHRSGVRAHRPTDTVFFQGYDGDAPGLAVPQPRGDVLCFSSLTLHRTGPNATDGPRRSWVIQFCRADTRHGKTGELLDDRLLVARGGVPLQPPLRERELDLSALSRSAGRR